jgi:hypothetical protein
MTDDENTATAKPARRPAKPQKPKFRVKRVDLNQPDHAGTDVVPAFDTEGPARRHITQNYPRGREVFLELPDGSREHYSQDVAGQGDDPWMEFHPDELED